MPCQSTDITIRWSPGLSIIFGQIKLLTMTSGIKGKTGWPLSAGESSSLMNSRARFIVVALYQSAGSLSLCSSSVNDFPALGVVSSESRRLLAPQAAEGGIVLTSYPTTDWKPRKWCKTSSRWRVFSIFDQDDTPKILRRARLATFAKFLELLNDVALCIMVSK